MMADRNGTLYIIDRRLHPAPPLSPVPHFDELDETLQYLDAV